MRTTYDKLMKGLKTMLPEDNKKEIIGAVVAIAYDDGTFDNFATLPDAEDDFNINLVGDLLGKATYALLYCHCDLSSALKKITGVIA